MDEVRDVLENFLTSFDDDAAPARGSPRRRFQDEDAGAVHRA